MRHERTEPRRGHRAVEHTADVIVEAWGPDFESCLEEAVAGLVDVYLVDGQDQPVESRSLHLEAGDDEQALLTLLDEVLFLLDTSGAVPVVATVVGEDSGRRADIELCALDATAGTGAVPKAISRSELSVDREGGLVRCRFLVDV